MKYKLKIKLIFKWYDFWVGFYFNRCERVIYFFPIPMIGFRIKFTKKGLPTFEDVKGIYK